MIRYILFRLLGLVGVMIAVSMITFFLMHQIPGGPWDSDTSKMPLSQVAIANMRRLYGLDKPLWQQYLIYVWNAIHLDFGTPYLAPEETVMSLFASHWPVSIQFGLFTIIVWFPIGLVLGLLAALKQNTRLDYLITFFSLGGIIIPNFVMAFLLILLFTFTLHMLPGNGWGDHWIIPNFLSSDWIMPVIAFGIPYMGIIARYTRSAVIEVLRADFVRTAYAKGLSPRSVLLGHVLKNALIPIIAIAIPLIPGIITGSALLEPIFGIPGLGNYFVRSVQRRDYVLIMAVTLTITGLVGVFNLLSDILYTVVDPRVGFKGRE